MPLDGLLSQPGEGRKYNPGKLHSWSQRGPLLSVSPTAAGPLALLPGGQSQRPSPSLQAGAAKGKHWRSPSTSCVQGTRSPAFCVCLPCRTPVRLITATAAMSCMGKVRLDWSPASIVSKGRRRGSNLPFPTHTRGCLNGGGTYWEAAKGAGARACSQIQQVLLRAHVHREGVPKARLSSTRCVPRQAGRASGPTRGHLGVTCQSRREGGKITRVVVVGGSLKEEAVSLPKSPLYSQCVFLCEPSLRIALLFLSSGQGRKYSGIYSLPGRLGKRLIEKVAKISVKRDSVLSGVPLKISLCLTLVNIFIFFNSNFCQRLKGSACGLCEHYAATRDG